MTTQESTEPYHLVSFKLCPFVQRSVIVLKEKEIPFNITYIDLQNKPDWFLELSPLGKVPILQVGEAVLFESAVIAEYLDEVTAPSLHSSDPLIKARHRAWMEYASTLFMGSYHLLNANDETIFETHRKELKQKLATVEQQLGEGPFFADEQFQLVDAFYAPFFMRLQEMDKWVTLDLMVGLPRVQRWANALLQRPSVRQSVATDFAELYRAKIKQNTASMFTQLKTGPMV